MGGGLWCVRVRIGVFSNEGMQKPNFNKLIKFREYLKNVLS